MPRPFALRFRLPVTPVDRTKVVPNGNPCQIVSIMAEFLRTTVPAAPAQVLFWQKGRGGTGGAKQEGKQPDSGRRHTAATRAISKGVGQGWGKEQSEKKGNRGKKGSPENRAKKTGLRKRRPYDPARKPV